MNNLMQRLQLSGSTLALLAATSFSAVPALADDNVTSETVTVTGTSIRGIAPVGSPVLTLGRDDIVSIGAATTADILDKVPQIASFNQLQVPGNRGATGGGTPPGLRGVGYTLILLDGQRMIGENPGSSQPDITSLPPLAIERIEIVPDGASAIYGSEAVSGVINVITRKDMDGVETSFRGGVARNGYAAKDFGVAAGTTWPGGGVILVLNYNDQTDLKDSQLPFYTDNLVPFGGVDARGINCFQPSVTISGVVFNPPNYTAGTAAAKCTDYNNDYYGSFHRYGAVLNAHQQITDNLNAYIEIKHTDTDTSFFNDGPVSSVPTVTIPKTNPFFFLPAGANPAATSETVPLNIGAITGPTPYPAFSQSTTYIGGLNYNLPGGWELNAIINWGIGDNNGHKPSFDAGALNTAAAGTTTATALDAFFGQTSPSVIANIRNADSIAVSHQEIHDYQLKGDGPIWTLPGGDVKLAVGGDYRQYVFNSSQLNPQFTPQAATLASNLVGKATRSTWSAFAELNIPLVSAANAMPLIQSLTISAAVRHDELTNDGILTGLNASLATVGTPTHILNSAVTTNPKIGVTWSPVDDLQLRGSYGTSYRAPDMGDTFSTSTKARFFPSGLPPLAFLEPGLPQPLALTILVGGNPNLKSESAQTWSAGADYTPSWLKGFKLSANFWALQYNNQIGTLGLTPNIFSNPVLAGLFVQAFTGAQLGPGGAADLALNGPGGVSTQYIVEGSTLPIPVPTTGTQEIYHAQSVNIGTVHTDGLDLAANYNWSNSYGAFAASVTGTKTLDWTISSTPGGALSTFGNVTPYLKFRGDLDWALAPMNARVSLNYLGSYLTTYATTAGPTATWRVDPFITVDLAASYDMGDLWTTLEGTTFSINVNNALNVSPPIVPAQLNHGWSQIADPRGRMVWFGVKTDW